MSFVKQNNHIENNLLLASLREGSIDAFNEIYYLYASKLLSYVAKATKNKEDATGIVNDIFMSLWLNRKKLKPDTDITALLFSIAYRKRIDFFRRMMNAPIYKDYLQFQNELLIEDANSIEYNEFYAIFKKALNTLPIRLQRFLILSRIKYLSNNEIAKQLDVSEKTVRNGISDGLKLLKEQMSLIGKEYFS